MRHHLFRLLVTGFLTLLLGAGTLPANADDPAPADPTAPAVVVSGTPTVGSTLVASVTGFDGDVTWQWIDDEAAPRGETTNAYAVTASDAGHSIIARATGFVGGVETTLDSDPAGPVPTSTDPTPGPTDPTPGPTDPTPTEPAVTPTAAITGKAIVGRNLTATTTGFTGTVTYAWFADSDLPRSSTARIYRVGSADAGQTLAVSATGTTPDGFTLTVTSDPTLKVLRSATPTISHGSFSVGQRLTARPGSWTSSTSFTYRWLANGKRISGATHRTFRLSARQAGRRISVTVTGRKAGYQPVTRTSARTKRLLSPTPKPRVGGTTAVGKRVTAKPGRWARGTHLTYQWLAAGKTIRGAHHRSYRVRAGVLGKRLQVRVRGTKRGYETVSRTSSSTSRVQRIGRTTLSGSTKVGGRLTSRSRGWVRGTRLSYSWSLDGRRLSGVRSSSLRIQSGWVGKHLTVRVTGRKSGFRSFSSSSRRSGVISYPSVAEPISSYDCPTWAPIKGNANSGIYHVPGGRYYDVTKPEECFRTEAAARANGYRASRNG